MPLELQDRPLARKVLRALTKRAEAAGHQDIADWLEEAAVELGVDLAPAETPQKRRQPPAAAANPHRAPRRGTQGNGR